MAGETAILAFCLLLFPRAGRSQARPTPGPNTGHLYQEMLNQIDKIPIFDHHAHPGFADDPNVDAMTVPPGSVPLRLRLSNPELVLAARELLHYPFSDLSSAHQKWLVERTATARKEQGQEYFSHILDQLNIETSVANRVSMPDYLDPHRFRWVFFVDSFLFPFNNQVFASLNPDEAVYMPEQQRMLQHYLRQDGRQTIPSDFNEYLAFITRILEENQKKGGIAMKFEAAYFRSLYFGDPSRQAAAAVYQKYSRSGLPGLKDYTAFQNYIFRYLVREGGRLHLPVHIHTAVGAGDYFNLHHGNVLNLENVLRDPRYLTTTFVLLHGGYPYDRQVIWLAAMKNVYLDSSEIELVLYPSEFKRVLKRWLEIYPDKITYGSDAFPYNQAVGAEETYWMAVHSARSALAEALAEMVSAGEVTQPQALRMAHAYLHDTAASLYPPANP
ncbi:MAG: amidohydrolase family protein [Terriglobia bacterium]